MRGMRANSLPASQPAAYSSQPQAAVSPKQRLAAAANRK